MKRRIFFIVVAVLFFGGVLFLVRQQPHEQEQEKETASLSTIEVFHPLPGEEITNTYVFDGKAPGPWFFEAVFPVRVEDAHGTVIGEGKAEARDDWMTDEPVTFIGMVTFLAEEDQPGQLVFVKNNPSGLPEHAEEFVVPVHLEKSEVTRFKVFFGNTKEDPDVLHCDRVYPVERIVPKTERVALAALDDLLYGPTEEEKVRGYFTSINMEPRVFVKSVRIENRTAFVDFNDALGFQVGGSCLVQMIRAQIEETVKQFPTVDRVVLSIEGRTEYILEP